MDAAALRAAITVVTALPAAMVQACVLRHGGSPGLAQRLLDRQADMARRIAALILLQPSLDQNYQSVKANSASWSDFATAQA